MSHKATIKVTSHLPLLHLFSQNPADSHHSGTTSSAAATQRICGTKPPTAPSGPSGSLSWLENLLTHLGTREHFDLFGQSWGGMLGSEFAVTQLKGLKRLIIANSLASRELWVEAANGLLQGFLEEVGDVDEG